eukprot:461213-Pelagomonas_calceolata.AAC.5
MQAQPETSWSYAAEGLRCGESAEEERKMHSLGIASEGGSVPTWRMRRLLGDVCSCRRSRRRLGPILKSPQRGECTEGERTCAPMQALQGGSCCQQVTVTADQAQLEGEYVISSYTPSVLHS